jgi:hypothetical protein
VAIPENRGLTRGCGPQRGINEVWRLSHLSTWVLVEAARCFSGPAKQAVV